MSQTHCSRGGCRIFSPGGLFIRVCLGFRCRFSNGRGFGVRLGLGGSGANAGRDRAAGGPRGS